MKITQAQLESIIKQVDPEGLIPRPEHGYEAVLLNGWYDEKLDCGCLVGTCTRNQHPPKEDAWERIGFDFDCDLRDALEANGYDEEDFTTDEPVRIEVTS